MMAARLLALVRTGYYDGLTWHRVEHDFVIQGGSPGANEYVGLGQYLRDELGTVPHVRGTVGMSTRGHDTGDAQWFVNLKDNLRFTATRWSPRSSRESPLLMDSRRRRDREGHRGEVLRLTASCDVQTARWSGHVCPAADEGSPSTQRFRAPT